MDDKWMIVAITIVIIIKIINGGFFETIEF
jgi:hypothetical protein